MKLGPVEIRLVEDARQIWRRFSVQAMGLAIAIQGAWVMLPPEMVSSLPAGIVHYVTIGLLALGIIGRLVQQPVTASTPPPTPPPAQ